MLPPDYFLSRIDFSSICAKDIWGIDCPSYREHLRLENIGSKCSVSFVISFSEPYYSYRFVVRGLTS